MLISPADPWKRQRKFAKHTVEQTKSEVRDEASSVESVRMLFELMVDPSRYHDVLESFIARTTSRLCWGDATASEELKQRARELLIAVSPNGSLGNKLPFLMSMPEWLVPAKAWENRRMRTEQKFFETMRDEVRSSTEKCRARSWMGMLLRDKGHFGIASDLEIAYAVGMNGIAGALTIAAPMQSFCLAMCHHPQYQPVLHEEIDRVCGDRMPQVSDWKDMPVLRAFIRETLRWRPPLPTGIPHELSEDIVYDGYQIPAGSVMHPLEWSISRDPEVYPEPDSFNPMRWLKSEYPSYREPLSDYPTITGYSQFGYGRRTCQGQRVAEADLFVGLGSIAWLFSMSLRESPVNARDGTSSDPTMDYTTLIIAKPRPFNIKLEIRNSERAKLICHQFADLSAQGQFKDARIFWGDGKSNEGDADCGWGRVLW